ncbi:MAG TPA: STAS domain-containing protein [candidate division Zixibacteria bacterium]|nr:STAS domain-containing protein [candidate division Zixibacteria bacterium]
MEIVTKESGEVSVMELRGRLDLASGATLKEEIKNLFEKERTSIHLNLSRVEFINSSGLGALVSIMKEVRLRKGRLTLSDLASYVQEIFDITQLSHIFEIFNTEEEAVNSYQTVQAG